MTPTPPASQRDGWLTRARSALKRDGKRAAPAGMHVCERCGRDLVNPVDWEPIDEAHWWIALRCGQCELERTVMVTNAEAARFDAELGRRQQQLADALARIEQQRMAAAVDAMIGALRRNLIDASDFAT